MTFCPPALRQTEERKREREREREKRGVHRPVAVMSHATNCQIETRALNLAGDRVAEFSHMLSVVTLTPA